MIRFNAPRHLLILAAGAMLLGLPQAQAGVVFLQQTRTIFADAEVSPYTSAQVSKDQSKSAPNFGSFKDSVDAYASVSAVPDTTPFAHAQAKINSQFSPDQITASFSGSSLQQNDILPGMIQVSNGSAIYGSDFSVQFSITQSMSYDLVRDYGFIASLITRQSNPTLVDASGNAVPGTEYFGGEPFARDYEKTGILLPGIYTVSNPLRIISVIGDNDSDEIGNSNELESNFSLSLRPVTVPLPAMLYPGLLTLGALGLYRCHRRNIKD